MIGLTFYTSIVLCTRVTGKPFSINSDDTCSKTAMTTRFLDLFISQKILTENTYCSLVSLLLVLAFLQFFNIWNFTVMNILENFMYKLLFELLALGMLPVITWPYVNLIDSIDQPQGVHNIETIPFLISLPKLRELR